MTPTDATTLASLDADLLASMFAGLFDLIPLTAAACSCRALRDKLQRTLRPMVAEGRLARRTQRELFRHLVEMEPRIETTRTGPNSRMSAVGPDDISIITATTAPVRGRMDFAFTVRAYMDNVGNHDFVLTVVPRTATTGSIIVEDMFGDDMVIRGYCRGVVAAFTVALAALGN